MHSVIKRHRALSVTCAHKRNLKGVKIKNKNKKYKIQNKKNIYMAKNYNLGIEMSVMSLVLRG